MPGHEGKSAVHAGEFEEFEVAEHAGDGEEAVVVWAVRNGLLDEWRRGLLRRLAAGAHCGEAAPQLGDDNDHPAYTFIEPSVGYRMDKGDGAGGIVGR